MKPPVRTTLAYGLISALTAIPVTALLAGAVGWPLAFKLTLWLLLLVYSLLLTRWSGKGLIAVLFPMALLLGTALWPGVYNGFFLLGLGVLGWIRSGICFSARPVRGAIAEAITVAGGAGLVALLNPGSTIAWAISIWLFFLVQALYFFMIPPVDRSRVKIDADTFEQAHREALRLLEG